MITVPAVLPRVNQLYRGITHCSRGSGRVGGHLHIVLDDANIEDGDVRFCVEEAIKDECTTCRDLALVILLMSKTQRFKLYREHV